MATKPYPYHKPDKTEFPIVTYAKLIGKNTAEFSAKDLRKFLIWLWKVAPFKNKQFVPMKSSWVKEVTNARNKRSKVN